MSTLRRIHCLSKARFLVSYEAKWSEIQYFKSIATLLSYVFHKDIIQTCQKRYYSGASSGLTQDGCEIRVTDTQKEYSSNFYFQILRAWHHYKDFHIPKLSLCPVQSFFFKIYCLQYNYSVVRTGAAHPLSNFRGCRCTRRTRSNEAPDLCIIFVSMI